MNRALHTWGIPMMALAILMGIAGLFTNRLWIPAAVLFVAGLALQFIGHAVEGQPPEFFKDWRFLFVGLRWWFAKITGRA